MTELTVEEIQIISGGSPLMWLGAAVLIYNACNIGYDFGLGLIAGANGR